MIQQKNKNLNYSYNNESIKNQLSLKKNTQKNKSLLKQPIPKYSLTYVKKTQFNRQDQSNHKDIIKNSKQKSQPCGEKEKLFIRKNSSKTKQESSMFKNKRKTSKPINLNISNSAIVLSQINQNEQFYSRKQRNIIPAQINHQTKNYNFNQMTTKNYNQRNINYQTSKKIVKKKSKPINQLQKQISLCKQKEQPRNKRNKSNFQIFSSKKNNKSEKRLFDKQRKHLSCASIIQGAINQKSKSRQKSKDKKNKKRKKSYKFKQINISSKQIQNKKRDTLVIGSIQKQFKNIHKKINLQLQRQRKKSLKNIQKDNSTNHLQTKNIKKANNKQNQDPKHNIYSSFVQRNYIPHFNQVEVSIKKEPLHTHKKLKEKPERKQTKKACLYGQKQDLFFLVRKESSPTSSRKQFPVNKYFTGKQTNHQSKRNSFQKTVKTNKKRNSQSQNPQQIRSHRQSFSHKNLNEKHRKKSQNYDKTKVKKQRKQRNQTYNSCLYLWADEFQKQKIRKNSQNYSDQELIYKSQSQQIKQQIKQSNKYTPKQSKIVFPDEQQTILRHKKFNSCIKNSPGVKESKYIKDQKHKQSILEAQSFNKSLNIQQIRYYQKLGISKNSYNQNQDQIVVSNYQTQNQPYQTRIFSKKYKIRLQILQQLRQIYPLLTKKQLQFLASICLIQRKWREITVSKKIKNLISIKDTSQLFKKNTNEKQMNKIQYKAIKLEKEQHQIKNLSTISNAFISQTCNKSEFRNLTTQSQNTQTEEFVSFEALETKHDYITIEENKFQKAEKRKQQKQMNQQGEVSQHVQKLENTHPQIYDNILPSNQNKFQISYSEQDIFPDICYIKTKKHLIKQKFIEQITLLTQQLKQNKISTENYFHLKQAQQQKYKEGLKQLHSVKKTLKKGYMKYIQTLNQIKSYLSNQNKKVKSLTTNSHKSLKRVNSEEGFIGEIYKKIFKIEQISSDNGSQSSGQTKRLNSLLLIRKISDINGNHNFIVNSNRLFTGIGKNLGTFSYEIGNSSGRQLNKLSTQPHQESYNILSMRQAKSLQLDQTKLDQQKLSKTSIIKLSQNSKIDDNKQVTWDEIQQIGKQRNKSYNITHLIEYKGEEGSNDNIKLQFEQSYIDAQKFKEEKLKMNKFQKFKQYKQYQTQKQSSYKIPSSHKMQNIEDQIDNIYFSLQSNRQQQLQDQFQHAILMEESKPQDSQSLQQKLHSEKYLEYDYNEKQLDDYQEELNRNYNQINHNEQEFNEHMPDHFSPITSMTLLPLASVQAKQYLEKFVDFLKQSVYWDHLHQNLNKAQGFTPQAYLRFIRQFQLTQQYYSPIIPNQAFQVWEQLFLTFQNNKNNSRSQSLKPNKSVKGQLLQQQIEQYQSWRDYTQNQYKNIEHRCYYQFLNSQLQQYRIYGLKGRPFPWETKYSHYEPIYITEKMVPQVIDKCMNRTLTHVINYSCGIILENHPEILTEQQLEELHDKNQDNIIDMLQKELVEQRQNWYQMEEHTLQLRLQIGQKIFYDLIEQLQQDLCRLMQKRI